MRATTSQAEQGQGAAVREEQSSAQAKQIDSAAVAAAASVRPAVSDTIKRLLDSVGVHDYEPQIIDMLIDLVYSYTVDVLRDGLAYGEASGQRAGSSERPSTIELQDIELAIRSRQDLSFSQAPSLELLQKIATKMNARDLPEIQAKPGLPLPGRQAMIAQNVQYRAPDAAQPQQTHRHDGGVTGALPAAEGVGGGDAMVLEQPENVGADPGADRADVDEEEQMVTEEPATEQQTIELPPPS